MQPAGKILNRTPKYERQGVVTVPRTKNQDQIELTLGCIDE